jgi:hypothetical protein
VRRRIIMVTIVLAGAAGAAYGQGTRNWSATLSGFDEYPSTLSTTGRGSFRARISADQTRVDWTLRYQDLEAAIRQAHIHFGDVHTQGGISVFLCTNLGNGPAGTQGCPTTSPATVTGSFMAADVIGPAGQGIGPAEFAELLRAIRARRTYANVHSDLYPGGEVRGQILPSDRRDDDDDDDDDDRGHHH